MNLRINLQSVWEKKIQRVCQTFSLLYNKRRVCNMRSDSQQAKSRKRDVKMWKKKPVRNAEYQTARPRGEKGFSSEKKLKMTRAGHHDYFFSSAGIFYDKVITNQLNSGTWCMLIMQVDSLLQTLPLVVTAIAGFKLCFW